MRIRDSPRAKDAFAMILPFLWKLFFLSGMVCLVSVYVLSFGRMSGNQMFPAVRDGDLCVFYRLEPYQVNDVVIYRTEGGERKLGRILACQGQTVKIRKDGGILVNGQVPAEEIFYPTYPAEKEEITYPLEIPQNAVFILNDFRQETDDSRENGPVELKALEGKLLFLLRRRGF